LYCPVIIQTPSLAYSSRLLLVLCPSFPAPLSGLHFCSPDSAYMSTRCTRANSAGKSGQPSTSSLWDSTPQAANAAPSGLAKSQLLQAKFEVPLLDDNGNDNSDDTPHQFSSKRRPRTYVLDAAPAMDDRDLTHSHRSWLRRSSSLANPTKITLGNIPATSVGRISIRMRATGQRTCAVLQDAPHVHDSYGNSPSAFHLAPRRFKVCEGPNHTFGKVITPGARNTEVHIPASTAHPLHASESVRLRPCLRTDNSVTCARTDATSHIAKTGLVTGMEILYRNTATGPCGIRNAFARASHTLGHVFSDVRGLLATQSQNGHNHLVTFVDNHARDASTYGQRDKSQVGQAFKAFVSQAQLSTRQTVEACYSDSSNKHDACHLQRAPRHVVSLHNASSTHAVDFFTPEDALSGNKPDVFRLRAPSCKASVHPGDNNSARRLVRKPSHHLIGSHTVVLDEGGPTHHATHHHYILHIILDHDGAPTAHEPLQPRPTATPQAQAGPPLALAPSIPIPFPPSQPSTPALRSTTTTHVTQSQDHSRATTTDVTNAAHAADSEDTRSHKKAMVRPAKWLAMCKLKKQIIPDYDAVSRPKDRKVIEGKWTFRIKRGPASEGATLEYKTCVTTQGFTRIEGGFAQPFVTRQTPLHSTLGTHLEFTHIVTALDRLAANAGTKRARHSTARLVPAPNLWAKRTLATPAMSGYALTLRRTPPGLRGRVGNPAAGDVR
jgi:hypothetical protein